MSEIKFVIEDEPGEQWQTVPVEPTAEMLAATSWPECAKTDYAHMLAALLLFALIGKAIGMRTGDGE